MDQNQGQFNTSMPLPEMPKTMPMNAPTSMPLNTPTSMQIGRASCRERV